MAGDELKDRVLRVVEDHVRPGLREDGGDVEVLDVTEGVVRVRLTGTCSSCPDSVMAVVMGIEQELRQHLPEVEYLEAVP